MKTTLEKPSTELTLPQRAAVALTSCDYEREINAKVAASADIVAVIDPAGREQAHRIGMDLLKLRTGIAAAGKDSRADATAFSKAVIEEEKRLTALITPEETRIMALRDAFDAKVEQERQAKIKAERDRSDNHKARLQNIRNAPLEAIGRTAAEISKVIGRLAMSTVGDEWEEFKDEATQLRLAVLDQLAKAETAQRGIESAEESQRQERARIEVDRAELETLRIEQQRIATEAAKQAAAELQIERDRQAAELAKERAEAARLQAIEDAKRKAERDAEQAERVAQMAAIREQRAIIDAHHAEIAEAALREGCGEQYMVSDKAFEHWYSINNFDYVQNPIGSRECGLQRSAWRAAIDWMQGVEND
jgi:hypothetical protein